MESRVELPFGPVTLWAIAWVDLTGSGAAEGPSALRMSTQAVLEILGFRSALRAFLEISISGCGSFQCGRIIVLD